MSTFAQPAVFLSIRIFSLEHRPGPYYGHKLTLTEPWLHFDHRAVPDRTVLTIVVNPRERLKLFSKNLRMKSCWRKGYLVTVILDKHHFYAKNQIDLILPRKR